MKRYRTLLAVTLTAGTLTLSAQRPFHSDATSMPPNQATTYFEQGNPIGSIEQLKQYAARPGVELTPEEAAFLTLASAYELNRAVDFAAFLKGYPQSAYTNVVRMMYGGRLLEQGEVNEAIEQLELSDRGWLSSADREQCRYQLAYAFLMNHQVGVAKPMFQELSRTSSRYANGSAFYLSYIAYREGDYATALKGFEPLQQLSAYRSTVPYYMVQIYFAQGNYAKSLELGRDLLRRNDGDAQQAEVNRIVGESHYYSGSRSEAITYLQRYVGMSSAPTRSSWYALGLSLFERGDMNGTVEALSKVATQEDIYSQTAYYHLALAYLKLGESSRARMAFEAASKMTFDDSIRELAMYNYALTIYSTAYSPFNESVSVFEQFLNRYPNSLYADKASEYLSELLLTTKNYAGSLELIAKIARPGTKILAAKQRILFYLGTEQVVNADFTKAIQYFNEAIQVGNFNAAYRAEALYWRGESYYRLEDYKRAIADYSAFITQTPDRNQAIYALGLYNLGYAYFKSFDFANARTSFSRYIDQSKEKQGQLYADALNRLGDCQYYRREFAVAEESYGKAAALKSGFEDYSLFQKAMMQGIRKQYDRKLTTIDQLLAAYPKSEYVDDALLERGLVQVNQEKYAGAVSDFQKLVRQFPNSNLAPVAAIQLSTVYRNMGDTQKAVDTYKMILSSYPGSDQAKMANADFKELSQESNRLSEYANYVNTLGGSYKFSASEQDSLTYLAAEQLYLRGNRKGGEESLSNYLQSFPEGAFATPANFYLGLLASEGGDSERAIRYLSRITSMPKSKFTEDAVALLAPIYYDQKSYSEAQRLYRELGTMASKRTLTLQAKVGQVRCAAALGEFKEVVLTANSVLEEQGVTPDQITEARYLKAKALSADKQPGKAADEWMLLSKDTRSIYGAEAKYQLAEYYFRAKQFDRAEKVLEEFVEQGTPHQYWMARAFLLWSDIYMAQNDSFQAKQYLMNLRNNYNAKDEISDMIDERLNRMEKK